MFDPRIELFLQHHPLSVVYRQPTSLEEFNRLERRKWSKADPPPPWEPDAPTRTIMDIFGIGFAALILVGLLTLVTAHKVEPPPVSVVAEMPPTER